MQPAKKYNILVLGSGAREHALAWKLSQSPLTDALFVAPGNAGTGHIANNIAVSLSDFVALGEHCLFNNIHLVIAGSEQPLVDGLADYFAGNPYLADILFVGPDKKGAQLEGSKDFSKQFMARYGIPTAAYQTFTADTLLQGEAYIKTHSLPIVLKADGLAAGKGVIIAETQEEAIATLRDMLLNNKFGKAGSSVVIEEYLQGIELSYFIVTDGNTYKVLPEAKDYKRVGEGDTGLNTGGMGAVSPVPFVTDNFRQQVEARIVQPTIAGLKAEGIHYKGFIFIGLMKVGDKPYVIEYNARLGDPETEVIIPRLESDLASLMLATANGNLAQQEIAISPNYAATVMLVSGGYPGHFEKGYEIDTSTVNPAEATLFIGGAKTQNHKLITDGGRVLACTGMGSSLQQALAKANTAAKAVQFEGKYFRGDVGLDVMGYELNVCD